MKIGKNMADIFWLKPLDFRQNDHRIEDIAICGHLQNIYSISEYHDPPKRYT
jgi:hypothetical protein